MYERQTETARQKNRRRAVRRQRMLLFGILIVILLTVILILSCCGRGAQAPQTTPQQTVPGSSAEGTTARQAEPLPEGWEYRASEDLTLQDGTLVLVNADHGFDPALPETVSVYDNMTGSYLVKDIYLSLTEEAMAALNDWMDAFAAQSGRRDVNIVAGWRSFADQQAIYDNAVATKGQAHADAYIALPGCSEHHTGLALDLDTYDLASGTSGGFDGDDAYTWAVEHAWEYGFVQRYPPEKSAITGISYESWHFRYVGLPHSYIMSTEDLCLEEYIELLRQHPFTGEHLKASCQGAEYEIYFCPQDALVVPSGRPYTVSGNNVDGYVVTVHH